VQTRQRGEPKSNQPKNKTAAAPPRAAAPPPMLQIDRARSRSATRRRQPDPSRAAPTPPRVSLLTLRFSAVWFAFRRAAFPRASARAERRAVVRRTDRRRWASSTGRRSRSQAARRPSYARAAAPVQCAAMRCDARALRRGVIGVQGFGGASGVTRFRHRPVASVPEGHRVRAILCYPQRPLRCALHVAHTMTVSSVACCIMPGVRCMFAP
jgi:hypothetical protein